MPDPRFTPAPLVDAAGDAWNESIGGAENIGAGRYTGPEAQQHAPWKCPACGVENLGVLGKGCVHCGSGKPGYHIDQTPPPTEHKPLSALMQPVLDDLVYVSFERWLREVATLDRNFAATENERLLEAAYRAGWVAGAQNQAHHTPMDLPPAPLRPESKPQRTIIAALELFKDQVLFGAIEEIATGEWCTVAEVEDLIARFKAQL